MAITQTPVATTKFQENYAGVSTRTSSAIDTTGASFLRIAIACFNDPTGLVTVSDSKGNHWTQKGGTLGGGQGQLLYFYADTNPPSVGPGHTFTVACTGAIYATVMVAAWSGVDTSAPLETTFTSNYTNSTTIQPGSLTPVNNGSMLDLVCCLCSTGPTASCDSGFATVDSAVGVAAVADGQFDFNLVQTTAAAVNPTVTFSASQICAAAMFAVKAAAGGGASSNLTPATAIGAVASFSPSLARILSAALGSGFAAGFTPSVQPGTLSSAAGVGTAAAFTPSLAFSLSAATSLGQAVSFVPKDAVGLPPAVGSGTVGALNTPGGTTLPTAIGLGTAGGFTPNDLIALAAAVATGTAAGLAAAISSALAAATANGNAASFVSSLAFSLAAANGTGLAASFGKSESIAFAPVFGVGAVGPFSTPGNASLTPATGQGAAGGFVPSVFITLPPAQAIGIAAPITPTDIRVLTAAVAIGIASSFLGASFFLSPAIGVGSVAALVARILSQTLRFTAVACPASFTVVAEPANYTSVAPGDANVM